MDSRETVVTIHMAASLDGFIARQDGRVDWMETQDEFPGGETLDPAYVSAVLDGIDCYVMGAKTFETALDFENKGFGWAYGNKPVVVLSTRDLSSSRPVVTFRSGDLKPIFEELRSRYRHIWVAGGGRLACDCVRLGIADEIRYSILPVLIGDGIGFFEGLDCDVNLHLLEVKAYRNGMVGMHHRIVR